MDCQHILDMIDAYALGATEPEETRAIEEHVADCVRCWDELETAQRTTALLALSVPLEEAPAGLAAKVIAQAQREARRAPLGIRTELQHGFLGRFRFGWTAAAGAFGIASLAAVAFTASLQMQVTDLEDENSSLEARLRASTFQLEEQLSQTDSELAEQQSIVSVLTDENRQEVEVAPPLRASPSGGDPTTLAVDTSASYTWSPDTKKGFLTCENVPKLPPGKVYQLWFSAVGEAFPIKVFESYDGTCQIALNLSFLEEPPIGIGISVEDFPGGDERPTGGWLLYARFSQDSP